MNKVVFIGAGPGDPELITLKGKRYLEQADVVIYAGSLLNPEYLKYAKPSAKLYDSAKMSLPEVLKVMVEAVKADKLVARVHDGDPSFYGAIQEQMDALDKEKIEYFRVPGVSCLQGGAGALNRELTLPNISVISLPLFSDGNPHWPLLYPNTTFALNFGTKSILKFEVRQTGPIMGIEEIGIS